MPFSVQVSGKKYFISNSISLCKQNLVLIITREILNHGLFGISDEKEKN